MSTVLIDNERLAVTLPDGFVAIPHKELESLIGITYDCLWGVRDTTRHMLVYASWRDSNMVLSKLASEKAIAKRADKQFSRCRPGSGYASESLPVRDVAGSDSGAHGFSFSYVVEGIEQEGELRVFKQGSRCYTLCYYTRSQHAAQNRPVFDAMLDSLAIG